MLCTRLQGLGVDPDRPSRVLTEALVDGVPLVAALKHLPQRGVLPDAALFGLIHRIAR